MTNLNNPLHYWHSKTVKILFVFIVASTAFMARGQGWSKAPIESDKKSLAAATDDSTRLHYNERLFFDYIFSYSDSAAPYREQIFLLAKKLNDIHYLVLSYWALELLNEYIGDYPEALKASMEGVNIAEKSPDFMDLSMLYMSAGEIYNEVGDSAKSISYLNRAKLVLESHGVPLPSAKRDPDSWHYIPTWERLARAYTNFNRLDSALKYVELTKEGYITLYGSLNQATIPYNFGTIYSKMGKYEDAVKSYHSGINMATTVYAARDLTECLMGLAKTYKQIGELDSSIYYANKVMAETKSDYFLGQKIVALGLLADIYKIRNNKDSLAKFLALETSTREKLFSQQKMFRIQNITLNEQVRQIELADQLRRYREKLILYSTIAALLVILTIASILWRNNKHKAKAYALLQAQKQETEIQKSKVEKTLEELKVAQLQLIQSEKMASLGELTAGIAHEIQNPLNFVNNFSDINADLIDELEAEINKGNLEDAKTIARDIKQNENKINQHGKRADAIVKGMLLHSNVSSGKKDSTDINALADEYLRLSYHGIRAKNKLFNAELKTDFDSTIGELQVVPQDIGRVLLNLYNNAFYALNEKNNESNNGYKPSILISTRKTGSRMEISVKDNGNGVPQKIQDKIFQPFFTTKPTGQGTGLGLSQSYDIIKAHNGEIKLLTEEGQYSAFIIVLPC
jgi:two-component system, NtrC family, sensor kinase